MWSNKVDYFKKLLLYDNFTTIYRPCKTLCPIKFICYREILKSYPKASATRPCCKEELCGLLCLGTLFIYFLILMIGGIKCELILSFENCEEITCDIEVKTLSLVRLLKYFRIVSVIFLTWLQIWVWIHTAVSWDLCTVL